MAEERRYLEKYNELYKENDKLYHQATRALGMSDCAFWIMYALRENSPLTQSELCAILCLPKQTVHSALKKLMDDGLLEAAGERDGRSKYIRFTEQGKALARHTVDRVMEVEAAAFGGLTDGEKEQFIGLFDKYTRLLKAGLGGLAARGETGDAE